jgi:hypothetical protein
VDRRTLPSTFFSNVVCHRGIAFLAYQFEKGAETGLDYALRSGAAMFAVGLRSLMADYWTGGQDKAVDVPGELRRWTGVEDASCCGVVIDRQFMRCSICLVHGDFHLRNVLFSSGGVLVVDFARSTVGPVVVDAAKMAADLVAFVPKCRIKASTPEELLDHSDGVGQVLKVFQDKLSLESDKGLLVMFFRCYLWKYLTYPDVSSDAKAYIARLFGDAIEIAGSRGGDML